MGMVETKASAARAGYAWRKGILRGRVAAKHLAQAGSVHRLEEREACTHMFSRLAGGEGTADRISKLEEQVAEQEDPIIDMEREHVRVLQRLQLLEEIFLFVDVEAIQTAIKLGGVRDR